MQILLTFLTIVAVAWFSIAMLYAIAGVAVAVGKNAGIGCVLIIQGVGAAIVPGAFLLARHLCR